MISRKALLIQAGPTAGKLNADLEAARSFLLSPKGGAWRNDEITTLCRPTLAELLAVVRGMRSDYTITFFSGEGFADSDGNRFLILDEGDFFLDTELLNASAKQLVLVDACSESFTEEVFRFSGRADDSGKARMMYDKWIERCEPGEVIIHATQRNTHAPSEQPGGGRFTRKLLQVAATVPAVENRFNLKSIYAAGSETPELLRTQGYPDGPAISHGKGNMKLPFAMAMPAKPLSEAEVVASLAFGLLIVGLFLSD